MNFIYPAYLFAIAGIIVPILIHLWNIRKGKTLKVGSILLLAESSKQQARSLRLHDLLLLMLRCLILIFFSILLAEPVLTHTTSDQKNSGWIIVEKESFAEAYKFHHETIDSLVDAGYEIHDAVAGYPALNLSDTSIDFSLDQTTKPANFWALFSDLNQRLPKDFKVFFLVPEYLNRFAGNRPGSGIISTWLTYALRSTDSSWIHNAYTSYKDSIHIVSINSNDSLTRYTTEAISSNMPETGSIQIKVRDGNMYLDELKNEKTNTISIDTSNFRIAIFSKQQNPSAKYITAALQAIQAYSKRKIQVEIFTDSTKLPLKGDWLFWMDETNVPENFAYTNRLILKQGQIENGISWINAPGMKINLVRKPAVSKMVRSSDTTLYEEMIWVDGYGNPILTKIQKSEFMLYQLFLKPEPGWTTLPWHEQFPELLLKLIFAENENDSAIANMMKIDATQIQPDSQSVVNFETAIDKQHSILKRWIWILLFLLFAAERIISFRRQEKIKI